MFLERASLLWAFACMLSGVAVYTGSCRAEYINGCMAHTIKGGIFLWCALIPCSAAVFSIADLDFGRPGTAS